MKPRSSTSTPAASAPIPAPFGPPPDRDEDAVEGLGLGHVLARKGDGQPVFARRHGVDPRAEVDRLVARRDALVQRLDEVGVASGDQLIHELDHRHLGAERVVDGGHLQADDPAADDEQALGDGGDLQRARGVHDALVVRQIGQPGGARARRDDAVLEAHGRLAVARPHGDDVRAGELPVASDHLDLALARQPGEAPGQPPHHTVLPAAHRVDVDLRAREGDAGSAQLFGLGEHARDVQQGLGGDAAHVQAYAAERLAAVDQRHLQTEVGGAEGRRVAARPGAEHRDLHADVRVGRRRRGARRLGRRLVGGRGGRIGPGAVRCRRREQQDQRALGDGVAHDNLELGHGPGPRSGDVHRRLVGLQRDERVLERHLVARRNQHLDDRHVGEVADVGDLHLDEIGHQSSTLRRSVSTAAR